MNSIYFLARFRAYITSAAEARQQSAPVLIASESCTNKQCVLPYLTYSSTNDSEIDVEIKDIWRHGVHQFTPEKEKHFAHRKYSGKSQEWKTDKQISFDKDEELQFEQMRMFVVNAKIEKKYC